MKAFDFILLYNHSPSGLVIDTDSGHVGHWNASTRTIETLSGQSYRPVAGSKVASLTQLDRLATLQADCNSKCGKAVARYNRECRSINELIDVHVVRYSYYTGRLECWIGSREQVIQFTARRKLTIRWIYQRLKSGFGATTTDAFTDVGSC